MKIQFLIHCACVLEILVTCFKEGAQNASDSTCGPAEEGTEQSYASCCGQLQDNTNPTLYLNDGACFTCGINILMLIRKH